jgi:hypothetical protein
MTKKDIERIIKQGTVKQQMKLYMTDVAMFNLSYNREEALLTDKERDLIWNNIKTEKDIKQYEELRKWNNLFTIYKPHLENSVTKLRGSFSLLWSLSVKLAVMEDLKEVSNEIINLIEEPKLRDKALKLAIKRTEKHGGYEYKEEGFNGWLDLDYNEEKEFVKTLEKRINKDLKAVKLIEGMLTLILTKHLPLKPYKDWIKEQIKAVNEGVKVIPTTIVGTEIKITPYKDIVAFSEEEIKSNLEKLKED